MMGESVKSHYGEVMILVNQHSVYCRILQVFLVPQKMLEAMLAIAAICAGNITLDNVHR